MDTPANHSGPKLISENYRHLNAELHRREPMYGTTGRRYVETIRTLANRYQARSILDYGCGKQDLWKALHNEFDVRNYDPALVGFDAPPDPADLVACIDVLEHIEPEYLDGVLVDLARVTLKVAFLSIATQPSSKNLADGTNCHRTLEKPKWWTGQLEIHFDLKSLERPQTNNGLEIVAEAKQGKYAW